MTWTPWFAQTHGVMAIAVPQSKTTVNKARGILPATTSKGFCHDHDHDHAQTPG